MPRVAAILTFSAALLLCCGYSPSVFAQLPEPEVARKFDEFGTIHHCDLTARLDNFAILVENTPGAKAHIVSYAPPGAGERLLELIKQYLVDSRGLKPNRITTIYGGRNSDLKLPKIELWIVPRTAAPPQPVKYKTKVETFKGLLADDRASDHLDIHLEDLMSPGIGGTTHASFADILNQQKNAVGYVVVYSGEDATPGAWRRIAQKQIGYVKDFRLEPDRIKVIFGGHRKKTRRQLWILPKDAPVPVRDAGPELPMAKAVKVGDFSDYQLREPENETAVFTRLKEILGAQKTVRAFIVVRVEGPTPVVDDYEPADLTKLVEKWRVELANTHKIGADRFIVLFTTAGEIEATQLSLWIVPKGQPLPDPNESEDEEGPGKE